MSTAADQSQASKKQRTNDAMEESSMDNIVTFDVGGKIFKTSRSCLQNHGGIHMLERLVSDTWQKIRIIRSPSLSTVMGIPLLTS